MNGGDPNAPDGERDAPTDNDPELEQAEDSGGGEQGKQSVTEVDPPNATDTEECAEEDTAEADAGEDDDAA